MKTVFLFIRHHSHISDLLRTEYIKYLSKKYRVVVFLPKREGEASLASQNYFQHKNITYVEWGITNIKWLYRFKLLRAALIRKYDHLSSVQVGIKNNFGDWRRKFLRRVSFFFPRRFFTPVFFTWLEKLIFKMPDEFSAYVEKYKPALIITATPGFTLFEAEAIIFAKKLGLKTVAINFSWDNITSNAKFIRPTDYLVTWNKVNKREAMELHGYSDKEVFVSGISRFDSYFTKNKKELGRTEFLKSKNLNPNNKTLLFATMHASVFPFNPVVLKTILELRGSAQGQYFRDLNIFVRVHPIESIARYSDFLNANIPNFHIELSGNQIKADTAKGQKVEMKEDDLLNAKQTLQYSDVVVTPFSTMTLEALIFDKPVINLGMFKECVHHLGYAHYKPLLDGKAAVAAYTNDELRDYIDLYLNSPETDRENRQKMRDEFIGFTDGKSFTRSVGFLDKIIKG